MSKTTQWRVTLTVLGEDGRDPLYIQNEKKRKGPKGFLNLKTS